MSWDSCVPPCPGNRRWDSWGEVWKWNVSICLGVRGGRETHSRSELVFVDLLPFKKPRNRFGIDFARLGIDSQPGKVYSSESIPWFLKRLQIFLNLIYYKYIIIYIYIISIYICIYIYIYI